MLYITSLFSMRRHVSSGAEDQFFSSLIFLMVCLSLKIPSLSLAYVHLCVCIMHVCIMHVCVVCMVCVCVCVRVCVHECVCMFTTTFSLLRCCT